MIMLLTSTRTENAREPIWRLAASFQHRTRAAAVDRGVIVRLVFFRSSVFEAEHRKDKPVRFTAADVQITSFPASTIAAPAALLLPRFPLCFATYVYH